MVKKALWWQWSLAGTHFCPPLDGCRVHALLPHALQVCQEDLILCLSKPALGKQPAAADVGWEPGLVQEEEVRGLTLHHSPAKITDRKQRSRHSSGDLTALSVKGLGAGRFVVIMSDAADDSCFFSSVRNIF